MLRFKSSLIGLSKVDCFEKNVSNNSSGQTPKTANSLIYSCYNDTLFDPMSKKIQYKNDQRGEKDRKDETSRKN